MSEGAERMSKSLDLNGGSYQDVLPDCADPFEEMGKRVLDARDRFGHLDRVLRECAMAEDAIYRTAAALWEAIAGPANDKRDGRL